MQVNATWINVVLTAVVLVSLFLWVLHLFSTTNFHRLLLHHAAGPQKQHRTLLQ